MNGIDALKAKFADVELKANARTMEEVVAYIEENWGAFRVKITESELMAHYKAACEFAKMMGRDVTDFQEKIPPAQYQQNPRCSGDEFRIYDSRKRHEILSGVVSD